MNEKQRDDHLSPERLQAFLEGILSPGDAAAVEAHASRCPRCRSELDAFRSLYEDLAELPELHPSPVFRDRVLESLPHPAGVRERMRRWLALGSPGRLVAHVGSARLQDHLDRRLAGRAAARVDVHLDTCAPCRLQLRSYRRLEHALSALPQLRPSDGFPERVMAELRIQQLAQTALAPTTRRERVLGWLRGAVPRTPRGWAAALGTAVAPAVTFVLLAQAVFSHPLVTVGNLISFAWLKGSALATRLAESFMGSGPGGSELVRAWAFVRDASQSSVVAAGAAVLLSVLTVGALWVLYRNVIASPSRNRRYAQLSV